MGLKEWKAEYYPVEAHDAAGTAIEATQHSLRKWQGMRREVMDAYGVTVIEIVAFTDCALCCYGRRLNAGRQCDACPLKQTLGRPCDCAPVLGRSEWRAWMSYNDAEPMITALERTLTRLQREACGLVGEIEDESGEADGLAY